MALVSIPGGLLIPPQAYGRDLHTLFNPTTTLDASGERIAKVFIVPKAGTLDKFEFVLGTVTQAPSNGLRCSFQDVDLANGDPDGTQDQFRVVSSGLSTGAWIAPGLITSDGTDSGTKRTVSAGDWLCCVVEFESFVASDSLEIMGNLTDTDAVTTPYTTVFNGTSWVEDRADNMVCVLKYSDGSYAAPFEPTPFVTKTAFETTFAPSSDPDEIGMIFRFPMRVACDGCWIAVEQDADVTVKLYDSDGSTVLWSQALDADVKSSTIGGTNFISFGSDITFEANTDYRLTALPTVTTVQLSEKTYESTAIMDIYPGGSNWHRTHRTDAGAWIQTTLQRPDMGLRVSKVEGDVTPMPGGVQTFIRGKNQVISL